LDLNVIVTGKGVAPSVQPDLQGLEISPGELRHLSGVDPTEVFRPSILNNAKDRWSFLFQEFLLSLALTPIIVGLLHIFVILPLIGGSLLATIVSLILVPISVIAIRWLWLKRNSPTALCGLLDEVERYNAVIKAIHINDQLEAVGTTEISLSDRQKVMEALTLTREDLVKALRAEKILRENQSFLVNNPELLATNLRTLQTLQVHDRASEYGRLLNEALQIASGVQEEMAKLQNKR
jgi:membrane-associated protease RseP (regulator of RpoE activity)